MKTRILSYLLVFSMILALLPASALAEGESTTQPYITATVKHALDSGGAETGQITAQIEAYLTDKDNQSRTVKPCDIIFLIEQSAFMNTQNDTTQYGQERADILNSMESLLQNLPAPTTGEHRVAIAGFGRINNSGPSDSYIESQHPGTMLSATQNPSLNTGYYTHGTDGSPVFHSQSGWTEWSRIPNNDETTLPQMPEGYLANENYDDVFMSIDAAEDVIDVDKMVSWHAGASRMDAGLQITKQLAEIAQAHKANSEDRNLIIFVAASSLPYQNGIGVQSLRPEAAQAAATELKNKYNATIFGFGDFRALNLEDSSMTAEKQRTQFNETMAGICGNSTTLDGTPYFKGLSQVHDINEALNELLIQIDANVNPNAKSLNINVGNFQEKSTEPTSHISHTWKELKEKHHILTSSAINETASVDYYRFKEYDANGNPQFDATPFLRIERSLSDIGSGDSIQTALSLQPIPPVGTEGTAYGVKAVITITDPVCVDYKWAGRWTPDFNPPDHEHAARGVKHSPTNPEQNETTSDTMKLKFDGWYRLWDDNIDHEENGKKTWTTYDGKKYVAYQDNVYDAFGSDLTLYGRWIPSIDVNFQWIGSVIPEGAELPSTVSLPLSDSGTASFTPAVPSQEGYEFDGWYKDSACTERYGENGENLTENTTLYGRWTRIGTKAVTFTVVNGSWNTASNWYNKITPTNDTKTLTIEVPLRNGKGTLTPDLVPHVDNLDMKPAKDYKAPGTWGNNAPVPANSDHIDALRPPAREGYTFLGWYDSAENSSGEPIDFSTRTFKGAATVYAHWAKNATVTFKIVNGYWSGNTAEDKTVTVVLHPQANGSASGTLDASHVPTIMIPAAGYENTPGHWDVIPNTEKNGISGDVTYTYIFGKKHHSSSSKDENKDKDNNKENNKENNKDNNTGETTPTKVPALLNGSNHFAYVVGYKDGNVRPQGNITRAETAAIFFRLLKEEVRSENLSKHNDFADVTEDSWYNTAVSTMAGMNILKGRTANSFAPQAPITRAEFAAICARFDSGRAEENSGFTDISGHWAEKEIERAATLGWVSGYTDGSFHPDAPITRAEAMTLINRVLCRMPETKADLLDSMTKWPDNQPGAWYYLAVQEATNSHTYEQKDSKYETWTALTAEPDWSKY